jgi:hypothetical protein
VLLYDVLAHRKAKQALLGEGIEAVQKKIKKGKGITKTIIDERQERVGDVLAAVHAARQHLCWRQGGRHAVGYMDFLCMLPSNSTPAQLLCGPSISFYSQRSHRQLANSSSWWRCPAGLDLQCVLMLSMLSPCVSKPLLCLYAGTGCCPQVKALIEKIYAIPDGMGTGARRPQKVCKAMTWWLHSIPIRQCL